MFFTDIILTLLHAKLTKYIVKGRKNIIRNAPIAPPNSVCFVFFNFLVSSRISNLGFSITPSGLKRDEILNIK